MHQVKLCNAKRKLTSRRERACLQVTLTSVTMMPAKGPRKMVYPSIKLKNPVALSMDDKGSTNVTYNEDLLGENLPWTQRPAPNDCAQYLSAPDVDILFEVSDSL
jgi:hypothetical protein